MHGLSATSDQLSDIVIQFREWSATLAFRRVLCGSAQSLIIICSHRELYKSHAAVHWEFYDQHGRDLAGEDMIVAVRRLDS
jgi:hypothetical protein